MAIVNVLRFNHNAGAMIADEEYWVWRRRKSYFTDHLYPLRIGDGENNETWNLVYGGVGHPPLHNETTRHLQKRLNQMASDSPSELPITTEAMGYLLLEEAQKTIKRRVSGQLRFLYGITPEDIVSGSFEKNGARYSIENKKVKSQITGYLTKKGDSALLKPLFESRGVLMGIDEEAGFCSYYFDYDKSIMAFSSGGFEAIGTGKYASGLGLASYLNDVPLTNRRGEIPIIEGFYTLISSALYASESFNEVGGYFQIAYLRRDSEVKPLHTSVTFIRGHRMKLATELVQACRRHFISRTQCYELLEACLLEETDLAEIEAQLFSKAKAPALCELRLSGFKKDVLSSNLQSGETIWNGKPGGEEIPPAETSSTPGGAK